jgi:hypothetical protein
MTQLDPAGGDQPLQSVIIRSLIENAAPPLTNSVSEYKLTQQNGGDVFHEVIGEALG